MGEGLAFHQLVSLNSSFFVIVFFQIGSSKVLLYLFFIRGMLHPAIEFFMNVNFIFVVFLNPLTKIPRARIFCITNCEFYYSGQR